MLARKMQATIPVLFSAMKVLRFFFFPVTSTSEIVFLLLSLRKNRLKIFESETWLLGILCSARSFSPSLTSTAIVQGGPPHRGALSRQEEYNSKEHVRSLSKQQQKI